MLKGLLIMNPIVMHPLGITNGTEFPYMLTIFAAEMLVTGIEDYYKLIVTLHVTKVEDKDYCRMMWSTADREANRLLLWLNEQTSYLSSNLISRLEETIHTYKEILTTRLKND